LIVDFVILEEIVVWVVDVVVFARGWLAGSRSPLHPM
jgi:hypothetical protein